jgi:50S ribosomal subunit-associated GTPase HflX
MNKWDAVPPEAGRELLSRFPGAVPVSALSRQGLEPLVTEILKRAPSACGVKSRDIEGDGLACEGTEIPQ